MGTTRSVRLMVCLLFSLAPAAGLTAGEVETPLAFLSSAAGIDKFATSVRYVYLEPAPAPQRPDRIVCKATFYPDCCSEKPCEIRSVYVRGGIAYKNWRPYHSLHLDVQNPQDVNISIALELRAGTDAFMQRFDVPTGGWTTLTVPLEQAAKSVKLDRISELRIFASPETVKSPTVLYLDAPRLAGGDPALAQKARAAEDATAAERVPAPPPRYPASAEAASLETDAKRTIRVEKDVPVAAETEVLVVGGGLAGVAAAVSAARNGARTMLVERSGALGGMATLNLVPPALSIGLTGGLVKEMDERLKAVGGDAQRRNPEFIKLVLLDMLRDAGAKSLLYTLATGAIVEGGAVKGIIVESKGGARAILSKVVVDCTGDADIAAFAGAPFEIGRGRDTETQAVTLVFLLANVDTAAALKFTRDREAVSEAIRRARKDGTLQNAPNAAGLVCEAVVSGPHGVINVNSINVPAVDGLNPRDLTYAHIQCLREIVELAKFFQKNVPGCQDCYLIQTGSYMGIRESRRIVGEYVLTGADLIEGRLFPDAAARGYYFIDIHNADHTGDAGGARLSLPYDIPYRCLVPKNIDGLLVAGRPISVDHVAHGSTRVMGTTMHVGQAAGIAAALAVKLGVAPRRIEGAQVQAEMRKAGAWPDYLKRVPDNLALQKNGTKIEVDSVLKLGPRPEGAIDGVILEGSLSRWVSDDTPEPHWLTLTFAKPESFRRVVLHFWNFEGGKSAALPYVPTKYQIQCDRNGQWEDIVREENNTRLDPEYTFAPVTSQKLRLFVTKVREKDRIVRLREIEVHP